MLSHPHSFQTTSQSPPDFHQRFSLFLQILSEEFVRTGQLNPFLSLVGVRVRNRGLAMERGGLRPLTDEALRLGLIARHGELGTASIQIYPDRLQSFLLALTADPAKF